MTLTANLYTTITGIGAQEALYATASGTSTKNVEEVISASGTDVQVAYTLDISACTLFYISANGVVTVETNNSSTPDDTIVLAANVPQFYMPNVTPSGLITTDISTIYVTNETASDVTIKIKSIEDATP